MMKQISIQDLKASLSAAIAEAEEGRTILITRHNQSVARLGPASPIHVHRGSRMGKGPVVPALRRGTNARSLAILLEDRNGR